MGYFSYRSDFKNVEQNTDFVFESRYIETHIETYWTYHPPLSCGLDTLQVGKYYCCVGGFV